MNLHVNFTRSCAHSHHLNHHTSPTPLGFSLFTTLLLALYMREEVKKLDKTTVLGSAAGSNREHKGGSSMEFWKRHKVSGWVAYCCDFRRLPIASCCF